MNKKKTLSTTMLLLLALSVLSMLSLNLVRVSAVPVSPYIMVVPEQTVDPTITPGMNYTISIYTNYNITLGKDAYTWQFSLTYNPIVLEGIEVRNGDLISKTKSSTAQFVPGKFNNTIGKLETTVAFFDHSTTKYTTTGPGTLAYVTFRVISYGDSGIHLSDTTTDLTLLGGYNPAEGGYYEIIDGSSEPEKLGHGYFCNTVPAPTHDIAVTSVTPMPTAGSRGMIVTITVIVENQGTVGDIFEVKAYYDFNVIETKTAQILAAGASETLSFTWNTTFAMLGYHTITAIVPSIFRETDTADNTLQSVVEVRIFFPGDVNFDGRVDKSDMLTMSKAYGSYSPKPNWDPRCDFNLNDKVDAPDLFALSKNYGKRV